MTSVIGKEEVVEQDVTSDSRNRLVIGAADMMRRRGMTATSVRELAKYADAPLGSTYHYFPGGKQQLATEAVRHAGDVVAHTLATELQAGPVEGLRGFLALWRDMVINTDFRAGCTVLAVAIEEPEDDMTAPLAAAAEVFSGWEALLADSLRNHGAGEQAEQVATLIVAGVEGTVAMCRARRSIEPFDRIATKLEQVVAAVTNHIPKNPRSRADATSKTQKVQK
jgi:AcrR family transcriptional regulator